MAHVLVGFAEALPAAEVVFSLRRAGHRVSAFGRSARQPLARLPLERLEVVPAPEADAAAAVSALRGLMAAPSAPDLVLPLDDVGLWLADAALDGGDPRSAGARGEQARVALDKVAQVEAARAAGLDVLPTVIVREAADLDQPVALPAIAKSAGAVRVAGGRLRKGKGAYLADEADRARLRAAWAADPETLLLQPLVAGVGEGIFGFATPEGVVAWSGHRRVRMMNPHGSGSSACAPMAHPAELRDRVAAFVLGIGWRGPFMVELLRTADGTPWFMELNGRMWGSMALARRQGLEHPAWAVAAALDPAFRPAAPAPAHGGGVQRDLGRDLLHLAFLLRGPRSAFHRRSWPGFWGSFGGVLAPAHPRRFYNYDPEFPLFFLRHALWTIRKAAGS